MSKIYNSLTDLVGETPLLRLNTYEKKKNHTGSVIDKIAKAMLDDAEAKRMLKVGSVIIEPTCEIHIESF